MDLSTQQQQAMDAVRAWAKTDRQVFRLFGYAGTGKTTIAREFANMTGGQVLFAAFTGKATMVLQRKGCYPASTIHRLIYVPSSKCIERLEELEMALLEAEDEELIKKLEADILEESDRLKNPSFTLNPDSELVDARMVVVDEVSMVGRKLAQDLLSFGKKVLCLGDPAQLPPVGCAGFFTAKDPDFLLTEIHRQAVGSPVLRLADRVRRGKQIVVEDLGTSRVVPKGLLSIDDVVGYDQIIVGTNKARRDINRQVRRHLGRTSHLPQVGDKLVALRNNYERGILNGSQWEVTHVEPGQDRLWMQIKGDGPTQVVTAFTHHFEGREREIRPWEMREAEHFDFGYAITCHKAQGSQWDNVLVIDESRVFRHEAKRWLYTAITRASESVTIVRQ
jgi:exodeoxyribonuclease-5